MIGPGKYDDETRSATGAHTVILIVIGGAKGDGVSLQWCARFPSQSVPLPFFDRLLPKLLRDIADQIEAETR